MAYHRRTLESLLGELKDSWESSPFWTDEEAIAYINHSLRTWNLLTGYWKKKVLLAASGTPYQPLPASLTFGMQVVDGASGRPVMISALADLDYCHARWEEETTASGGDVPSRATLWAPVGMREIALWPAPAAGASILLDGVAATPVVTSLSSYVDIDDWVAVGLVHYAFHVACFKRGPAAVQASASFFQDFIEAAVQQNERLKHATYFRKFLGLDLEKRMRPIVGPAGALQAGAAEGQQ